MIIIIIIIITITINLSNMSSSCMLVLCHCSLLQGHPILTQRPGSLPSFNNREEDSKDEENEPATNGGDDALHLIKTVPIRQRNGKSYNDRPSYIKRYK